MADGAELGAHVAGEFGGDVEAEAGAAGAHGDAGRSIEGSLAEFAPDFWRESGAEVAHADADFVASVGDGEDAGGVAVGIADGVSTEVVDDTMEEVTVCDGEAGAIIKREAEPAVFIAEKWTKLASNLVAEVADADRLHFEKTVLEASDFREIVDLADSALGNADELGLDTLAGRLVVGKVKRKSELAHKSERRFQVVRSHQNTIYLLTSHEVIIA